MTQTVGSFLSKTTRFMSKFGPTSLSTFASITVSMSEDLVLWLSSATVVISVTF